MKLTRMFTVALMLAMTLASVARGEAKQPNMLKKTDKAKMEEWVESTFAKMTPDERITQLFVMCVASCSDEPSRARLENYVAKNQVGGLIYMDSDMDELAKTANMAQSMAKVPLMITIDAEWGLSMRMPGVPHFQRNLVLGAIDDDRLLYEYGREMARQLRRMGIHVSFAPVLDVNDNPQNPVIGTRSFGEDPDLVARHGIAYARGLEDGGVMAVGKHFPGHGSSSEDSHKTLPVINKSIDELSLCEFAPFRKYIDAGLSGMLTAHLYVPAIEKERKPSTMSRKCVTDLLQKQMGFQGLVFTDALNMQGALAMPGSPCVNALLAGNDVLLMPLNADGELKAVKMAIEAGRLKQKDIDERCKKILRYKYALGLTQKQTVTATSLKDDLNKGQADVVKHRLASSSVTVLKNEGSILPLGNLMKNRIAVVTMGSDKGLKSMFHDRADDYAEVTAFDLNKESASAVAAKVKAGNFNTLIVGVESDKESPFAASVNALLPMCDNIVLVLMTHAYDIEKYSSAINNPNVKAVVLTYEKSDIAEDYAVQTIFGGNAAKGHLPISLKCGDKQYAVGTGITYDATRLGYTVPAEVGMDNYLLHQIDSVASLGVREKAFPGCQVIVGRLGKIVAKMSFGEIAYGTGIEVTDNTLYGLASVSKATGTLSAVMKVYDNGGFQLDEAASKYIPGLRRPDKQDMTFRSLLYHETGMPPSLSMWQMMMDPKTYKGALITNKKDANHTILIMAGAYGHKDAKLRTDILSDKKTDVFNIEIADGIWGGKCTYDSIMNRIYAEKLGPKKYLYSCLNFSLLANAVENITHQPLNVITHDNIFGPLGAYHTMYRPLEKFDRDEIAYTEVDTYLRRQHIHGYVHDELAAFSGGVQGNAGLFSTGNDLAKLLQMWLNGGTYGGERYYKPETVKLFTTDKSPRSHRGLGFDKPVVGNPDASNTCEEATPETFGHTGFTGTCFWVDPANDMFYIFLSNRVSPTRSNPNFGRISARSHIHSLIYKSIKK
ncbi:MAG: serine hydrolase [Bacteroidales bacterium]|nr:serine hydrolase [Candidatus Sodaliphilus limicaballi]